MSKKYPWKYLNGEKLFRYYWEEMGNGRSCVKLAKWAGKQGLKNPNTGKPPSPMAVWFAMWRWALIPENQKVAYDIYNKAQLDLGGFVSPEQWKEFIKDKASVCLDKKRYANYLKAVEVK